MNCSLDVPTRRSAFIDPVRKAFARDVELVRELGLALVFVLVTHVHADHVTSAGKLAEIMGAVTAASPLGAECASTRHALPIDYSRESRAAAVVAALRARVKTRASVLRDGRVRLVSPRRHRDNAVFRAEIARVLVLTTFGRCESIRL